MLLLLVIMLIWGIKISFFQESLISSTTLCFTLLLFTGVYLDVLVIRKRIDFFKLFGLIGIFTLLDYGFNLMGLKNIPVSFNSWLITFSIVIVIYFLWEVVFKKK